MPPSVPPLFGRYDPKLVQELAITQEPDEDVLARYGFSGAEAMSLAADPVLKVEVAALTQELRRAGTMARIKARFVAEELIGQLRERVVSTEHRSVAELLDVLKVMAKIGDLEPREAGGKLTGTIVRVDLSIGSLPLGPVIAASTVPQDPRRHTTDALVIDLDRDPDIPGELAETFTGLPVTDDLAADLTVLP